MIGLNGISAKVGLPIIVTPFGYENNGDNFPGLNNYFAAVHNSSTPHFTTQPVDEPPLYPVDCTADVMQCPNGSYVGRDSSNGCQFFQCPTDRDPNANYGAGTGTTPSVVDIQPYVIQTLSSNVKSVISNLTTSPLSKITQHPLAAAGVAALVLYAIFGKKKGK